ncbi:LuxR C-terminal-related transcriptional regulator [Streptomyces sp. NPDC047023]|uniref:LuxR C-terminal-related transcriptional regulator n=1 Tax=Streptomyces sp. NPDC047023 TaxID=3155139 RepID=UPI0033F71919
MTTLKAPITPITPSQKRLAAHLLQGLSNSEIAAQEYLALDTVSSHLRGMRQNLHCPPRCSRPVLAHMLLVHRQVGPPPVPPLCLPFAATEDDRLLLHAIAEHSAPADIARAARIAPCDLKPLTESLIRTVGATSATHLVGLGHALGLLGESGTPRPPAHVAVS